MKHQKPFVDFTLISIDTLQIFIFEFESGLPSLGLLCNTVSCSSMVTRISVRLRDRRAAWWESQDIHEIIPYILSPKTSICPWSGPPWAVESRTTGPLWLNYEAKSCGAHWVIKECQPEALLWQMLSGPPWMMVWTELSVACCRGQICQMEVLKSVSDGAKQRGGCFTGV